MLNVMNSTIPNRVCNTKVWIREQDPATGIPAIQTRRSFEPLRPLRQWLNGIEVQEAGFAHLLCKLIPSQCPFERTIAFCGHTLFHIPPLCKLNPFYNEVVALRFRALCYLADVCGEDITPYC